MKNSEQKKVLTVFNRVLKQEFHNLQERPDILWQQLYNRLQWEDGEFKDDSVIKVVLPEFENRTNPDAKPWFRNRCWPGESKELIKILKGHTGTVRSCAFSSDGKTLASAGDKTVRFWHVHMGTERAVLEGHTGWVNYCAFSPDGKTLASAGDDKTVRLWDAHTGRERAVLEGHTDWVYSCAFSPDGKFLVSVGGNMDKSVRLWDVSTGTERAKLESHTYEVKSCVFSPDGKTLASTDGYGMVRLWDVHTGGERAVLEGHTDWVYSCAFSPDGTKIVSASDDNTLKIWDSNSGDELSTLAGHTNGVKDCVFSSDGVFIVSASDDGSIKVWDSTKGKELASLWGHAGRVECVSLNPDSSMLASGGDDKTVMLWSWPNITGEQTFKKEPQGHLDKVNALQFSPDGTYVVSGGGSEDGLLRFWSPVTGELLGTAGVEVPREIVERHGLEALCLGDGHGHSGEINGIDVSSNGSIIVSASEDGKLKIWDARRKTNIKTIEPNGGRPVFDCSISPDGSYVVSACGKPDFALRLWDTLTGHELRVLRGHSGIIATCTKSHDGSLIVSGSLDRTVKVWDPMSGKNLRTMNGHSGGIIACAINPKATEVVSASLDGSLKIWNLSTGLESHTLQADRVTDCAFCSDGALIVSVREGGWLDLWDTVTGQSLTSFPPSEGFLSVTTDPLGSFVSCGEGKSRSVSYVDDSCRAGRRRYVWMLDVIAMGIMTIKPKE